jgi:hypothetical protein
LYSIHVDVFVSTGLTECPGSGCRGVFCGVEIWRDGSERPTVVPMAYRCEQNALVGRHALLKEHVYFRLVDRYGGRINARFC